jgi:hypothetical protein
MDVSVIFVLDGLSDEAIKAFKESARKNPTTNVVLAFTLPEAKDKATKDLANSYLESWQQIAELTSLKITYFKRTE